MGTTELAWLPWMLQTADPLFPTGSYAHSLGFEQSVQLGDGDLGIYLKERIVPALREFELPYVRFAYEAAHAGDLGELLKINAEVEASKLARETREAGAQLGQRRFRGLRTLRPHDAFLEVCEQSELRCQNVVAHSLQSAVLGAPLMAALLAYYYQTIAAVGAAAMKLMRIGQEGVQSALTAMNRGAEEAVSSSLLIKREAAGWFDPLLEIASMRHERAAERLFIS